MISTPISTAPFDAVIVFLSHPFIIFQGFGCDTATCQTVSGCDKRFILIAQCHVLHRIIIAIAHGHDGFLGYLADAVNA